MKARDSRGHKFLNYRISMIDAPRLTESLRMGAQAIQKHERNGSRAFDLNLMADNLKNYQQRRQRRSPNTKY